jgi:hypothetical protein
MPLMPNPDPTINERIRLTCPSCGAGPMEKHKVTDPNPTLEELRDWTFDQDLARATDGCEGLEVDGMCEHGHWAWPRALGMV